MSTFSIRHIPKDSVSHTLISFSINKIAKRLYNWQSFQSKQGNHCYLIPAQSKTKTTAPNAIFLGGQCHGILGTVQFPQGSGNTDSHYVDF